MQNGVVKVWDKLKGWGFIEGEDGFDYFFHSKNVRTGQIIQTGDNVKFDENEAQRGPTAENVTKV